MKIHILLATLLFAAPALVSAQNDAKDDPAGNLQKFQQFYRYLNGAYVDTVHNNELVESAIREVLLQLDPHSTYVSPEEMVEVKESFDGSFSGIGIEFNVLRDTIIVVNVISGGPAEQVGLLPNDRIVAVDGKSSVGVKQIDVPKLLRGPKGSWVETRIVPHGGGEPLDFTIVRDNIPINTVDAAYKVDPKTGYIRINRFANNTYKEFTDAVQKLGPMEALILDLRSNGGGLMGGAVQLSNFFLPEGSVIVSTEGMRVPPDRIVAKEDGPFTKGKVIVLINETSASASEIVSGAIQDWDRGVIVGRRTFGKGLVQKPIPLPDGSMIRLTVSRYYTPTGRCIQKPYENGKIEEYHHDLIDRYNRGELMSADSIHFPDSMKYNTLVTERTVYGGGGIMPDVFIPVDTTRYTDYHRKLVASGLVNRVSMNYLDRNRNQMMAKYPKFQQYKQDFVVGEDIMEELLKMAGDEKIEFEEEEYNRSKPLIMLQIKALIARDLYDMAQYFQIINDDNPSYQKALQIINNKETYNRLLGR